MNSRFAIPSYHVESMKREESNLVFRTPWPANSLSWSVQNENSIRLAISSYLNDYKNYIEIIEKDSNHGKLISKASWEHCYPPTKVLLPPRKLDVDLVITTADYLRLWQLTNTHENEMSSTNNDNCNRSPLSNSNAIKQKKEELFTSDAENEHHTSTNFITSSCQSPSATEAPEKAKYNNNGQTTTTTTTSTTTECSKNTGILKSELKRVFDNGKPNDFCSPVTSCDWNSEDVNLVACCSIDTTVTMWDLERGEQRYKLVAHDKDVYDVAFASAQTFASCGADGSVRFFDLRNMDHCTILYETQGLAPLLRVAWNQQDSNYISTFGLESTEAIVIDVRYPSVPASLLSERHKQPINGMAWSPQSAQNICTVGEDGVVCIWSANADVGQSLFQYTCDKPINSVAWRQVQRQDWIAITTSDGAQLLRL